MVITQLHIYHLILLLRLFGLFLNCICNPHLLLFFIFQFVHQLLVFFFVFREFVFLILILLALHHRLIFHDCWCCDGSCITTLFGLDWCRRLFLRFVIFVANFLNIIWQWRCLHCLKLPRTSLIFSIFIDPPWWKLTLWNRSQPWLGVLFQLLLSVFEKML